MDPTERLQILKRETVLLDPFQRVDVLTLSEMVTFRTQTLRGFTLKQTKGRSPGYTNRPNVTAVNVSTNRLIVVHARGAVHISGEVLDGKNRALLLLSLTEADLKASAGELSLLMGTRLLDAQEIQAEPALTEAPADAAPAPEKRRRKKTADADQGPADPQAPEAAGGESSPAAPARDDIQPIHAELNVGDIGGQDLGVEQLSAERGLTPDVDLSGLTPDAADDTSPDMPF